MPEYLIDEAVEDYAFLNTSAEPPLLQELIDQTNVNMGWPQKLSGRLVGRTLKMLSALTSPKRALEIGMFTGYGASPPPGPVLGTGYGASPPPGPSTLSEAFGMGAVGASPPPAPGSYPSASRVGRESTQLARQHESHVDQIEARLEAQLDRREKRVAAQIQARLDANHGVLGPAQVLILRGPYLLRRRQEGRHRALRQRRAVPRRHVWVASGDP